MYTVHVFLSKFYKLEKLTVFWFIATTTNFGEWTVTQYGV
jgi:hypothetical protein